jgi:hypothetical protein
MKQPEEGIEEKKMAVFFVLIKEAIAKRIEGSN